MRILHISTSDNVGGAARAACRLHSGLRRIGYDSFMFVAHRYNDDPAVTAFELPMDFPSRLGRLIRREWITRSFARYRTYRPAGCELFSDSRSQYGADLMDQLPPCDVINLHWIAGFVDYQAYFSRVPQHTPVVWTLHDMNAFTGGCHYDDGCGRYTHKCGACPQLGSTDTADLSRQLWQRKRAIFEEIKPNRLHIVTPSHWLAKEAERSSLFGRFPISVIPNSLDTDVFSRRDRCMARAAFEVPRDARAILFAADSTGNRRKGFALLGQALADLGDLTDLYLISLGSGNPAIGAQIPHLHLGHIGNDRLLSLVYSAADLFVIPSLQDNLPNTVLESLACGTPVVGFAVGGIPDMVRPGVTGLLAPSQDVSALRAAIADLLQDPAERAEMSVNCRCIAVQEYSQQMQAQRYVELYERMLASTQHFSDEHSCAVQP